MNSTWLTVAVALLSGSFALGGHWLAGLRSQRLAAQERAARRVERDLDLRRKLYSGLVLHANAFVRSVDDPSGPESADSALVNLRTAAAEVELYSPAIAEGPLREFIAVTERVAGLARRAASSGSTWTDAIAEFQAAREHLLSHLRTDLGRLA